MKRIINKIFTAVALTAMLVGLFCVFPGAAADDFTDDVYSGQNTEPNVISYSSPQDMMDDMELVADDKDLELWFDYTNSCLAIVKKDTKDIFLSNPYNADEKGRPGDNLSKLKSQLSVSYFNQKSDLLTMYSWPECVENGNFTTREIKQGIEVSYSLGGDDSQNILPLCLPKSSMDEIRKNLNAEKRSFIDSFYEQIKQNEITERVAGTEFIDEGAASSYGNVYILTGTGGTVVNNLTEYFKEAGYNKSRQISDLNACGITIETEGLPSFNITVRYFIENGNFKVTVPSDSIFPNQIESFNILPVFAAATLEEAPDGYLFLPDGCGAVIAFDDDAFNKPAAASNRLYQNDASSTPNKHETFGNFALPVFGTKAAKTCVLGIIEDGQAMAGISANLGGVIDPYFNTSAHFTLNAHEIISLSRDGAVDTGGYETLAVRFDKNIYKNDYSVIYTFLSGDDANYIGMANSYRDYLKTMGAEAYTRDTLNFCLQTVGAVNTPKTVFGIPVNTLQAYTTFDDTSKILDYLLQKDIDNIDLFMDGWQKNGLDYTVNNKFSPSGTLGGKRGFNRLVDFCDENKIGFYPIADMGFVCRDKIFDGFSTNSDSTRRLTGELGSLSSMTMDTNIFKAVAYAVSPDKYKKFASSFMKGYTQTNAKQISFGAIGSWLNGNYKSKKSINRGEAMEYVTDLLKEYSNDYGIAVSGANAYCLPYVSYTRDLPLSSSKFTGMTYEIPFLQMVLDGLVSYSAAPLNFVGSNTEYLLKCIESKSAPAFIVGYENTDKLKFTAHDYLFNINFNDNIDGFITQYNYVKEALDGLASKPVTLHERKGDTVRVQYAGGEEICINYGTTEAAVNGLSVPPMSYIRTERADK